MTGQFSCPMCVCARSGLLEFPSLTGYIFFLYFVFSSLSAFSPLMYILSVPTADRQEHPPYLFAYNFTVSLSQPVTPFMNNRAVLNKRTFSNPSTMFSTSSQSQNNYPFLVPSFPPQKARNIVPLLFLETTCIYVEFTDPSSEEGD